MTDDKDETKLIKFPKEFKGNPVEDSPPDDRAEEIFKQRNDVIKKELYKMSSKLSDVLVIGRSKDNKLVIFDYYEDEFDKIVDLKLFDVKNSTEIYNSLYYDDDE